MSILYSGIYYFFRVLLFILVAEAVMSWFIRPGDRAYSIFQLMHRITDPILNPIRRLIYRGHPRGGIDFSPLIAILIISMLERLLYNIILR